MGRLAVEALLAHHNGQSVPQEFILPISLIVRRSCGCLSESVLNASEAIQVDRSFEKETLLVQKTKASVLLDARRAVILGEMQRVMIQEELPSSSVNADNWLDTLILDLDNGSNGEAFLTSIDLTSRRLMEQRISLAELQNLLSAFRLESCRALVDQPALIAQWQ